MGGRRRWPAGTLWLVLLLAQTVGVEAADIKVIASTGVASVVTELGRQFEAKTEHKVARKEALAATERDIS